MKKQGVTTEEDVPKKSIVASGVVEAENEKPDPDRTAFKRFMNGLTCGILFPRSTYKTMKDLIPVDMTLFIRQKGYCDLKHTVRFRVFWLIFFLAVFAALNSGRSNY